MKAAGCVIIGIVEKKMETLGPFKGIYRESIGVILGNWLVAKHKPTQLVCNLETK